MLKTRTRAAKATTTIPSTLDHDVAILRRELEAATDAIVPLLAGVDPIQDRVLDAAITLDPEHEGSEAWSEVSRLAGTDDLERIVQRLLAAIPRSVNDAAGVGDLKVKRIVA
jgi:hypothetical protein